MIAFDDHLSGKRVLDVLDERLGPYGLQLHPAKTRFGNRSLFNEISFDWLDETFDRS